MNEHQDGLSGDLLTLSLDLDVGAAFADACFRREAVARSNVERRDGRYFLATETVRLLRPLRRRR